MVACSAKGVEVADIVREEGIRHESIPFTRSITPLKDIYCLWRLFWLIKREKPDIVHSHTPKAGLIGMLAAYFARVPMRLHTVAGLPLMEARGIKRKILVLVERLVYRSATRVYPNSYELRHYIEKHIHNRPGKLKVLANGSSNGIDLEYFKASDTLSSEAVKIRRSLGLSSNDRVAIFIGRLVGDKGINELIRAVKKISDVHLILVGAQEPELDPLAEEVIHEIESNQRVHAVGFQNDVRPFLVAADFLVFPSYREGFPNVPLQAGAMGLASIVTDINGCNEIITRDKNGLVIPPKDEEALVIAIQRILNEKELLESLQLNARNVIEEKYDRHVVWEALHKEYLVARDDV